MTTSAEQARLDEAATSKADWRRWGPYLSERAWSTVREDYSANGDAWNYFPHDHARSRAFRWSEDGIAGFCDEKQTICLALALWNERDPILKERMFGLTNQQGNHGEDVKEYWFYLDGTPTHSYMKMLYKYPQVAYPYAELVAVNGQRNQQEPEFELFDALRDAFIANRYFDVFVEYAKGNPEDILCRITVINRGPDAAPIHVLPHLWYRNTWSWENDAEKPSIQAIGSGAAHTEHTVIGERWWYVRASEGNSEVQRGRQSVDLMFTDNETNLERLYGVPNRGQYVKDGINDAIVEGQGDKVSNSAGTKLAGHVRAVIQPGATCTVEVRFSAEPKPDPFGDFDSVFAGRIAEADAFYATVHGPRLTDDEKLVQRQAFAGLLWSKQFYHYNVYRWLTGDPTQPKPPDSRWHGRNHRWKELNNADVILMPDKWEYPWYASWDLAFHCVSLAHIDPAEAKKQLLRMGFEWYQHASGQFPAYEWSFDDIDPPVLGWAAWRVYQIEEAATGKADVAFLKEMFQNDLLSFSFWVNRKDATGRDIFGGGFLGMDNIGVFDRDQPLANGGELEQSDGTSWMARFAITLLATAIELARHDPFYQNMAIKYFEHFLSIAHAMTNMGGQGIGLWDEQDQFYYDVVHLSDGTDFPLRIHSMVGIVPLFAVRSAPMRRYEGLDRFMTHANWFLQNRPDLVKNVAPWDVESETDHALFSVVHGDRLKAVLRRVLDPNEFLSDYGVRALSRYHLEHPYEFEAGGQHFVISYAPGESDSRLFGGNSNWRGPIWFPVNYLLILSIREYAHYYGNEFTVECPTGSGEQKPLDDVACDLVQRLTRIFLRDPLRSNRRAVWGDNDYFQNDPHWRDYIPFHEYFHGDSGRGIGASHQTGWTALIASLLSEFSGR